MPGPYAAFEDKKGIVKGWDASARKWLVHLHEGTAVLVPLEHLEVPWTSRRQPGPILSTLSWEAINQPGASRHVPGGTMTNSRGEVVLWRELAPRALKKVPIEPGTMSLRCPGRPPPFLYLGRDAPD